jgi:hypothetical protein
MKLVNRLKEQTILLLCFRYKECCNNCRHKSVYLDTPQLSFPGCADSVATVGRMPVAAIDMHGDSRGDPSAARGIHNRASQGPPPQHH